MTARKKFLVFFIICCSLLTVPVLLSVPAGALSTTGKVTITGNIPLVTYNPSVSGIDWYDAVVTWKTNENANSTVAYGTTTLYDPSALTEPWQWSTLSPSTACHRAHCTISA